MYLGLHAWPPHWWRTRSNRTLCGTNTASGSSFNVHSWSSYLASLNTACHALIKIGVCSAVLYLPPIGVKSGSLMIERRKVLLRLSGANWARKDVSLVTTRCSSQAKIPTWAACCLARRIDSVPLGRESAQQNNEGDVESWPVRFHLNGGRAGPSNM